MSFFRETKFFKLHKESGLNYEFIWTKENAPVVASNKFSSISEIEKYLTSEKLKKGSDIKELFELVKTLKPQRFSSTRYQQTWIYLTTIIIPIFWMFFLFRLLQELSVSLNSSTSFKITLLMLILVSLTFASPPIYIIYRGKQDNQDAKEQLELLYYLIKSNKTKSSILEQYLFEQDGQVFWKVYRSNWKLSLFYPEFTIIDVFGLFSSIFSLVYLFTWFSKSFELNLSRLANLNRDRVGLIVLNIVLLIVFIFWVINGLKYGRGCDWDFVWKDDKLKSNIRQNLLLLVLGTLVILTVEVRLAQFSGTYVFLILMAEIPLIMAFITNRIRLFQEYNQAKDEILYFNNNSSIDLDQKFTDSINTMGEDSKLLYSILMSMKISDNLSQSPTIPATRIRSYGLLLTFILSIIGSFITAFNSSVDQFTKILSLLFG